LDIVQIVPRMPPLVDGIGDYSLKLAGQLRENHKIVTTFLVCQQRKRLNPLIEGFPAINLLSQDVATFVESLPADTQQIVLHYTNYPYVLGKHDAPFWLLNALESARKKYDLQLIVMFHELPLLKRTQYIRPIQGFVALRIAKLADHVLTNCASFEAILSRWVKQPVNVLPVFSNVCEPRHLPSLSERQSRMIVFGGPNRARIYKDSAKKLARTCDALGIEEIYDIGPSLKFENMNLSDLVGVPVVQMGVCSLEEISDLMLTAIAGFFDYSRFPGYLAKSGVFAAYCAHGLIPVSATYNPSEGDGIKVEQHYLVSSSDLTTLSLGDLQAIAHNAHSWYSTHNQQQSAARFAKYLHKNPPDAQEPFYAS
jgi:hypothetical protein